MFFKKKSKKKDIFAGDVSQLEKMSEVMKLSKAEAKEHNALVAKVKEGSIPLASAWRKIAVQHEEKIAAAKLKAQKDIEKAKVLKEANEARAKIEKAKHDVKLKHKLKVKAKYWTIFTSMLSIYVATWFIAPSPLVVGTYGHELRFSWDVWYIGYTIGLIGFGILYLGIKMDTSTDKMDESLNILLDMENALNYPEDSK